MENKCPRCTPTNPTMSEELAHIVNELEGLIVSDSQRTDHATQILLAKLINNLINQELLRPISGTPYVAPAIKW